MMRKYTQFAAARRKGVSFILLQVCLLSERP
jgi:hypothetical protein